MTSLAIFHDYFAIRGGGEKLVLTLANSLGARLVYGYRTNDSYPLVDFPPSRRTLGLPSVLLRPGIRPLSLAARFAAHQSAARSFDVRIFSGVAAPFAAPAKSCGGVNIFYCHTPPRFLFDQRSYYLGGAGRLKNQVASAFERLYRRAVNRMHVVVTNSETTRARIRTYLGLDSIVVHPPIDTDRFTWRGQGDYFLSTARLSSLKRVDRIIDAFLQMPDKRLIVASGGEDLELLKTKAAGASNIKLLGWVDDEQLIELVGHAIATIYVPREEDFGMSPVESLAAGKPVIGVAEGGLLETITEKTGILINPGFSTRDLVAAVIDMTPQSAERMRKNCEERAQHFREEKFLTGMRRIVETARAARRGG